MEIKKSFFILHMAIFIYSITTVFGKLASMQGLLSASFVFFFGMEFVFIAVYAVLWQQAIKNIDISVAYSNKALGLLWSLAWSVFLFKDEISPNKLIGISLVFIGVLIINMKGKSK